MRWNPHGLVAALAGAEHFDVSSSGVNVTKIGSVAVISLRGPLDTRAGNGVPSYEEVFSAFVECLGSEAIVFDIDSPGGMVSGCFEAARAIRGLALPPVFAVANYTMASAAYALACVADRIVAPASARVGSIGVRSGHISFFRSNTDMGVDVRLVTSGAQKLDGDPDLEINEEAVAREQLAVDKTAEMFFAWVKERRGIDARGLEGACLLGADAVDAGLTDGTATLGQVLGSLIQQSKKG